MSSSLSRQRPSPDTLLKTALTGGAALALGLFTAFVFRAQLQPVVATFDGLVAQFSQWLGAAPIADSRTYWYMARSAGIVAYLLLWGSVVWGLLVSSKLVNDYVKPALVYEVHQFLSILALVVGMFHGLLLLGDTYMKFTVFDVLIPFVSPYQPFWVGLGILGLYLTALLVVSFYIKKHIGHKTWRTLHYSSFALWVMITLHSIFAGSDSGAMLVQLMYLMSVTSVSYLLIYRIVEARQRRVAKPTRAH